MKNSIPIIFSMGDARMMDFSELENISIKDLFVYNNKKIYVKRRKRKCFRIVDLFTKTLGF